MIKGVLNADFLSGENASTYIKFFVFLFFLGFFMVYSGHYYQQKVVIFDDKKKEYDKIKSEHSRIKSELQRTRLETGILVELERQGIKQSDVPPQKIIVKIED